MTNLTYEEVGATGRDLPAGYHHARLRRVVGQGRADFDRARALLFSGEVQRRAGAEVRMSETPLREGTRVDMRVRLGPVVFRIPCLVVWAERTDTFCGFAYGTLPGHPERGEERFELRLEPSGQVVFSIIAFSRPGRWFTRLGGPLARRFQAHMTRRYLSVLAV